MTPLRLRARARQLVRLADFSLNVLFWLSLVFIGVFGSILSLVAFQVEKLLGVGVAAGTIILILLIKSKKDSTKELLEKADGLVDGTASRLATLLKALVEEALSSAATSFAMIPIAIVAVSALLYFLKYRNAALFLLFVAIFVSVIAMLIYNIVSFFALREIDHVVGNIMRDGKKESTKETSPLVTG